MILSNVEVGSEGVGATIGCVRVDVERSVTPKGRDVEIVSRISRPSVFGARKGNAEPWPNWPELPRCNSCKKLMPGKWVGKLGGCTGWLSIYGEGWDWAGGIPVLSNVLSGAEFARWGWGRRMWPPRSPVGAAAGGIPVSFKTKSRKSLDWASSTVVGTRREARGLRFVGLFVTPSGFDVLDVVVVFGTCCCWCVAELEPPPGGIVIEWKLSSELDTAPALLFAACRRVCARSLITVSSSLIW